MIFEHVLKESEMSSYLGAGINKREGRRYGTGEEKVCIQKL